MAVIRKLSRGGADGETEAEGEIDAEVDDDGETETLVDDDGLTDADGDGEADAEALGLMDALGLTEGEIEELLAESAKLISKPFDPLSRSEMSKAMGSENFFNEAGLKHCIVVKSALYCQSNNFFKLLHHYRFYQEVYCFLEPR